jgi:undecaprenyl-diphosphatase
MKALAARGLPVATGAIAAFAVFAAIAWATGNGPLPFDEPILRGLRDSANPALPLGPQWIGDALRGVTTIAASATLVPLAVIGAALLAWRRRPAAAVFVLVAIGGGVAVNALLKQLFARTRPTIVEHLIETHTTGFPSGHAFNAASACITLCLLLSLADRPAARRAGIACAIAFAALTGLSRVYFGVHWPSDVIAGWSAGTAWALLCGLLLAGRSSGPFRTLPGGDH